MRFALPTETGRSAPISPAPVPPYAELEATSNFTFLTGASHPDEFAHQAAALGYRAIAITDTNSLAGIVRTHVAAKDAGIQLIVGCRIVFTDASLPSVLVYPTDLAAYGRLCRLLTLGKRRAPKGECHLTPNDLFAEHEGLIGVVVMPRDPTDAAIEVLHQLRRVFDEDRLSLAVSRAFRQDDAERIERLSALSASARIPLVVTNAAHYHVPERRTLQDVLTCVRHGCTLEQAGFRLLTNAERHLKPPEEMHRLFVEHPRALARTLAIAERCKGFTLDQLRYNYPDEIVPVGTTAMTHLRTLTAEGASERFPGGVPAHVQAQIDHELRIVEELHYAPYFLTVHDLVRFARQRGILCQGRGAAANSAVCFCLGVTAVDPSRGTMLFERFISKERNEPPDIDIDFEHERREEAIQYLYTKYGRDRAALTAEVISYRGRSAVRDVGKAMGLSLDAVDRLAREIDWWSDSPADPRRLREIGMDPSNPHLRSVLDHARTLMGFPRHLSQHVGGFVITCTPLSELVPIENAAMVDRTVIEWDKDDIDALGMLKVDVLGLGMLTCLRKCLDLVAESDGQRLTLATIPAEDPATYDMICAADTVGVFQIESRAQMSMLPRLRPRCFYDLVIEVAIVRPGPIQGKMVHPYIRRRNGEEPVVYASPEVERVLGRTLGVPLFQEQCMALAVAAAGFTPGEADQLRRAMAAWKRSGQAIHRFERQLIDGMTKRGYSAEFAGQVFQQISGFSGYGFPESHAASFAILVYASCWLKRHKPAAFATALLNSQPMGFYQPAQIVQDAQKHGVEVRPIDVNHSRWDCTLEPAEVGLVKNGPHAVRLGMRLVSGLSERHAEAIGRAVEQLGRFTTLDSLCRATRRADVPIAALRHLAQADAFGSMGLTRRAALWSLQRLHDEPMPLFDMATDAQADSPDGADRADRVSASALPVPEPFEEVAADYARAGLSLKAHPVSFVRDELDELGVTPCATVQDVERCPAGREVSVAGLVLVRQRPGTASGIVFMTIEDETGIANLILFPKVYQRFRAVARHSSGVICTGRIERAGQVVHVSATRLRRLTTRGDALHAKSRDFH
ncbi:MAG: error-prone DNA polymerase [Phycisphaeraceae bacterium]|nr:error-prone DNA polymerase [Phycisphaeraceae bacterium]